MVSKGLRWTAAAIAGLLLLALAMYLLSRWLGPTRAQRQALQLMEQHEPLPGRNAFSALWLIRYDIPEAQREGVIARDLRRFDTWLADRTQPLFTASTAHGRYPDAAEPIAGVPESCPLDGKDCLAMVRADPDGYARWREARAGLVERAALDGFGHYRSRFPARLHTLWPPAHTGAQARLTSQALDFVQGRPQDAFVGVCADVATWRRLGTGVDEAVMRMTAMRIVDGGSQLFARMLAESTATGPLPAVCELAFAPPAPADVSVCEMMKGELAGIAEIGFPAQPGFEPEMHRARIAHGLASACSDVTEAAALKDRPLPSFAPTPRYGFDCVANLSSCLLADIAWPAYRSYALRAQDHGARLRLAATVYWLHANPDDARPLPVRLATRPEALRGVQRGIEVVPGGGALRIALNRAGEDYWELPLALPAAGATVPGATSAADAAAPATAPGGPA